MYNMSCQTINSFIPFNITTKLSTGFILARSNLFNDINQFNDVTAPLLTPSSAQGLLLKDHRWQQELLFEATGPERTAP